MNEKQVLMQVKDLSVTYETRLGPVSAVDGVSFDIFKTSRLFCAFNKAIYASIVDNITSFLVLSNDNL